MSAANLPCPTCNGRATLILATSRARMNVDGREHDCISRRRHCTECGHRWSTVETAELAIADLRDAADRARKAREVLAGVGL